MKYAVTVRIAVTTTIYLEADSIESAKENATETIENGGLIISSTDDNVEDPDWVIEENGITAKEDN